MEGKSDAYRLLLGKITGSTEYHNHRVLLQLHAPIHIYRQPMILPCLIECAVGGYLQLRDLSQGSDRKASDKVGWWGLEERTYAAADRSMSSNEARDTRTLKMGQFKQVTVV